MNVVFEPAVRRDALTELRFRRDRAHEKWLESIKYLTQTLDAHGFNSWQFRKAEAQATRCRTEYDTYSKAVHVVVLLAGPLEVIG